MKKNPHRIEFTVSTGFKDRVKLLAAKWRVKSNVAIQRAVDLALTRESSDDEKALLKTIAVRTEDILRSITPA
jgi:hypothetical protein